MFFLKLRSFHRPIGSRVQAVSDTDISKVTTPTGVSRSIGTVPNELSVGQYYSKRRIESLRVVEKRYFPNPDFIELVQKEGMPEQWRARVNVWFLEVGVALSLQPHTIATASALTDRYLSIVSVTRRDLAIVSTTAILIAAKVHEMWIPDLLRTLADAGLDPDVLSQMESVMLHTLEWNTNPPSAFLFLDELLWNLPRDPPKTAKKRQQRLRFLSQELLNLALIDYKLSTSYFPSQLAAAASIAVAEHLNGWLAPPCSPSPDNGYSCYTTCMLHRRRRNSQGGGSSRNRSRSDSANGPPCSPRSPVWRGVGGVPARWGVRSPKNRVAVDVEDDSTSTLVETSSSAAVMPCAAADEILALASSSGGGGSDSCGGASSSNSSSSSRDSSNRSVMWVVEDNRVAEEDLQLVEKDREVEGGAKEMVGGHPSLVSDEEMNLILGEVAGEVGHREIGEEAGKAALGGRMGTPALRGGGGQLDSPVAPPAPNTKVGGGGGRHEHLVEAGISPCLEVCGLVGGGGEREVEGSEVTSYGASSVGRVATANKVEAKPVGLEAKATGRRSWFKRSASTVEYRQTRSREQRNSDAGVLKCDDSSVGSSTSSTSRDGSSTARCSPSNNCVCGSGVRWVLWMVDLGFSLDSEVVVLLMEFRTMLLKKYGAKHGAASKPAGVGGRGSADMKDKGGGNDPRAGCSPVGSDGSTAGESSSGGDSIASGGGGAPRHTKSSRSSRYGGGESRRAVSVDEGGGSGDDVQELILSMIEGNRGGGQV